MSLLFSLVRTNGLVWHAKNERVFFFGGEIDVLLGSFHHGSRVRISGQSQHSLLAFVDGSALTAFLAILAHSFTSFLMARLCIDNRIISLLAPSGQDIFNFLFNS